jgi:hypothetical protein
MSVFESLLTLLFVAILLLQEELDFKELAIVTEDERHLEED